MQYHQHTEASTAEILGSDGERGLTNSEASKRLMRDGENGITRVRSFRFWRLFISQLTAPLSLILLCAAGATFFLGDVTDGVVVLCALALNVALGVYQEGRASQVFDELTDAMETYATVLRDSVQKNILAREVVVGDVLVLESGKTIPADARLIAQTHLLVNESVLTGEWVPVQKVTEKSTAIDALSAGNMVWSGTVVVEGTGRALVTAIGAQTSFGAIALSAQCVDSSPTPLTVSVRRLARTLMVFIGVIVFGIVILGVLRGEPLQSMLLIAIAVSVAAMPEGLPAALTVVLAVAMERILKKGGLVKSLLSAETLGSTTVILTDKTGTLTTAHMQVQGLYSVLGMRMQSGVYEDGDNAQVLRAAVIASDAFVENQDSGNVVRGRPVEQAIVEAGIVHGVTQESLRGRGFDRLDFLSFTSQRRYAGSLNREQTGEYRVYLSGAPEKLLDYATQYVAGNGVQTLEDDDRVRIQEIQKTESARGARCIGVGYVPVHYEEMPSGVAAGLPRGVVFVGLVVLGDTIRADVPQEIARAHEAQIRVIMLTGDFPETARAVAAQVGIAGPDAEVLTGTQIETLSDAELWERLQGISICARVLPNTKLRIAQLLRAHGEVVAMTGDGVNDAPALQAADIGIAVGSGTDVAQAASDMILLKNTFATITAAIAEGRRAIDNVRKAVLYLLSTSVSEVVIIAGAVVTGLPLPLLPTQLLWTNVIHEGFMSVPYAFEPADKQSMRRVPRGIHETILTRELRVFIGVMSVVGGLLVFGVYGALVFSGVALDVTRTIIFAILSLLALTYALSLKDMSQSLIRIPLMNNPILLWSLGGSLAVLGVSLWVPMVRDFLSLAALPGYAYLIIAVFVCVNVIAIEGAKWGVRRFATT